MFMLPRGAEPLLSEPTADVKHMTEEHRSNPVKSSVLCSCDLSLSDQIFRRARGSRHAGSVRALLVYPAVDGVFQRSVMLLAERLQRCGGVSVVIDVWERRSLAEQGPLRWINSQADLAERVLIVSPPPRTQTGNKVVFLAPMHLAHPQESVAHAPEFSYFIF